MTRRLSEIGQGPHAGHRLGPDLRGVAVESAGCVCDYDVQMTVVPSGRGGGKGRDQVENR